MGRSLYKWSRSCDQDGRYSQYIVKSLFYRTRSLMILKLVKKHRLLKFYKVCINDHLDLDLLYGKVKLDIPSMGKLMAS